MINFLDVKRHVKDGRWLSRESAFTTNPFNDLKSLLICPKDKRKSVSERYKTAAQHLWRNTWNRQRQLSVNTEPKPKRYWADVSGRPEKDQGEHPTPKTSLKRDRADCCQDDHPARELTFLATQMWPINIRLNVFQMSVVQCYWKTIRKRLLNSPRLICFVLLNSWMRTGSWLFDPLNIL